jgi:tetratricopeptide (TPR) repeat protein
VLQTKGYKEKASDNYEKAASIDPDNPYIYYNLARISEERADLAGARALYEKAIDLELDRRPGVDARKRLTALRRGDTASPETSD